MMLHRGAQYFPVHVRSGEEHNLVIAAQGYVPHSQQIRTGTFLACDFLLMMVESMARASVLAPDKGRLV
jgi:hypothetical protein